MAAEQTGLARLLQERRERAGYSRARLGEIVGISAGTIEGWELGRVGRPPFHDIIRLASFLQIPFEDLQTVAFADAGSVTEVGTHPGPASGRRRGRKKHLGPVPLLDAAFALCGWENEDQAAAALAVEPEQVRSWRRGLEPMGVADYLALTTVVNVALTEAMTGGGEIGSRDLEAATRALGVDRSRA